MNKQVNYSIGYKRKTKVRSNKLLHPSHQHFSGIKPTKDTRTVNLASLESLIMVLAELKKYHVSRDSIQRTFNNAAYSYLIPERCSYHQEIGVSHCSVTRCHAGAKLLSNYLNQLYPSARSSSEEQTSDFPVYPTMNSKQTSTIVR